jgi:hypothetical protein
MKQLIYFRTGSCEQEAEEMNPTSSEFLLGTVDRAQPARRRLTRHHAHRT